MNKVEPIRTKAKLDRIRNILIEQSYRNYMLFQFPIHIGMRIGDILELRVKDVKNKEYIYVTEMKTRHRKRNKRNRFTIPKTIRKELLDYIETNSSKKMIICSTQVIDIVFTCHANKLIIL